MVFREYTYWDTYKNFRYQILGEFHSEESKADRGNTWRNGCFMSKDGSFIG